MYKNELTGRTRHRVLKRLFRKPVLVMQSEITGFVPEFSGGICDGRDQTWWIDTRVEWLLERESCDEIKKS